MQLSVAIFSFLSSCIILHIPATEQLAPSFLWILECCPWVKLKAEEMLVSALFCCRFFFSSEFGFGSRSFWEIMTDVSRKCANDLRVGFYM